MRCLDLSEGLSVALLGGSTHTFMAFLHAWYLAM